MKWMKRLVLGGAFLMLLGIFVGMVIIVGNLVSAGNAAKTISQRLDATCVPREQTVQAGFDVGPPQSLTNVAGVCGY